MKLVKLSPKRALNKAFLKHRPLRKEINLFKENLLTLLSSIDEIEREENQKNHVRDFLRDTYYKGKFEINTKDTKDLVIHTGRTNKDTVGVIIEAKRPSNKNEMLSFENPNAKAFHELVLYYLRERIEENNADIKYLIATNIYEWYIIEASYFENLFNRNKTFVKAYKDWRDKKKVTSDTNLFYNEIAKPFIDTISEDVPCIYFDIRDYDKVLKNADIADDKQLIALYKILSPYHLLKEKFLDDSNKLDEKFYKELLHLIGLEEAKDGSKSIIRRKKTKPDEGSLIENAITILNTESLNKVENKGQYGNTKQEMVFNIALELCITWINRILFLKLLEAQLIIYHNGDNSHNFLNFKTITDFDELYKLFHQVLAKKPEDRSPNLKAKYNYVPYLNSSLFEISPLEEQTIKINSLDNSAELALINTTILKEQKKKTGKLPFLEYIFSFLNAYDFASEGSEDIQETEEKSLINASVLGKVFEKINGYKDGSIFTPGFITMYMSKQAVRLAVAQKFKDTYKWNIDKFEDIKNYLTDRKNSKDILEFNAVINSLRICDPAVGSGHFLVSVLNEIIAVKAELGILADEHGYRITDYEFGIENDELIITDPGNNIFTYHIESGKPKSKEMQRLQQTLFNEKRIIIENCLFGVDINPNSVKICRLRLWIELLKNAYYKVDTNYKELETLPNIDINIKCGNSLVSRYNVNSDLKEIFKERGLLEQYKTAVLAYKSSTDKEAKDKLLELIKNFRNKVINNFYLNDPLNEKLSKYKGQLALVENKAAVGDLFEKLKEKDIETDVKILKNKIVKIEKEIQEIRDNKAFQNAFEWRFDFPEVLDENGKFLGFNLIIGNPPYIRHEEIKHLKVQLSRDFKIYNSTADILTYFFELGNNILIEKGVLSFIVSNKFFKVSFGSNLRSYLTENTTIQQIIEFDKVSIFSEATVKAAIVNTVKSNAKAKFVYLDVTLLPENLEKLIANEASEYEQTNYNSNQWIFQNEKDSRISQKIFDKGIPLAEWDLEIYRGLLTGYNEAFLIDEDTKNRLIKEDKTSLKIIKPLIRGREVEKYSLNFQNTYLIFLPKGFTNSMDIKNISPDWNSFSKHIPAIADYLLPHQVNAEKRQDKGDYWWELRACDYYQDFEKPKIIWKRIGSKLRFCYDESGTYTLDSTCIATGKHLKYLTGVLNSKIINQELNRFAPKTGTGDLIISVQALSPLRIPVPTEEQEKQISNLVDRIIDLKNKGKDYSKEEMQIDELVYDLYDINKEERKIIEENINV